MVIADSWYAAKKAAEAVTVEYTPGPTANVSEKDLQDHAAKLIAKADAGAVLPLGNTNTAPVFRAARSSIEATYTTSTVLHFADGAAQRPRLREGRQVGDPHRQPVAEPRPALAGDGARSA